MNPLSAIKSLFLFCLVWYSGSLLAADSLYVFVFKNGLAQKGVVIEAGGIKHTSNRFGLANFDLPPGEYEISYYQDKKRFALTDIRLLSGQQSQLFLTLTKKGEEIDLDLPLAAYDQDFEQSRIKKMTGPKGTLKLILQDSETGKAVVGARVFVKGYTLQAQSDRKGVAQLQMAKGKYDLSIIDTRHVVRIVKAVSVDVNKTQQQIVRLTPSNIEMEEYIVSAPAVEGSLAATFTELKNSDVVADAISSEQFSKSGDSSAASALKRVSGITVVNGKYVYVRGLGERYSVVLLNDLFVPSPEPTKRVVPLDIFPASVIQSMNIQKTFSANLPGNFAGGDVLIHSKDIPREDNYIKLSLSSEINSYTGKKFYSNADNNKGMPENIIQKSSNFQELQQGFPAIGIPGYTQDELTQMNRQIVSYRRYNLQKTVIKPGNKLAFNLGQSFKTASGIKYGVVGTLYASSSATGKDAVKYSTYYDIPNNRLDSGEKSEYQQTLLNEKTGGLLSFMIDNMKGQQLKYTFLAFEDLADSTTYSEKDGGAKGPGADDEQRVYYEFKKKNIMLNQLSGKHHFQFSAIKNDFFNDIKINWAWESARATRKEPGTVEYYYEKISDTSPYSLNKKIWFLYSDLKDELSNYRLDITLPYKQKGKENYTSLGLFRYNKYRVLDNRRFKAEHTLGTTVYSDIDRIFNLQSVDNGELALSSNYRPADAYTAKHELTALYLNQRYTLLPNLDVFAGFRLESSTQQLIDSKSQKAYDPLVTNDGLLSASLNYQFRDDMKLRLGFSNTLSRPDFREFSPNRYKDPITEDIVFGYPRLSYSKIRNLDIKYEWYLSYDEVLSFSLFQKDFVNPVEKIVNIDPDSQFGKKIVSYRNALGATSNGIELGFRKKLSFINPSWANYFVSGNYSLINSAIRLDRNSNDVMIAELSTTNRPMQGQSPYVLNFKIGYDNINTGRSAILLFNEFGKRIVALGSYGAPDYYEFPFPKLDFVVKWQLNDTYDEQEKKVGYNLNMNISNILDAAAEVYQGKQLVESYKPGVAMKFTFSVKY